MEKSTISAILAGPLLTPALAAAVIYQADAAHSTVAFTVRHMMVTNVTGTFPKFTATVAFDPDNPAQSKVEAVIDAASINTGQPKRDDHLRTADFFDVANSPTITFVSRKVESAGEGRYRVTGDLTIRGTTKEVVLDVDELTPEHAAQGVLRRGVSAATRINRKDFGVGSNSVLDGGGVVLSDEVRIRLDLELVRKP